MKRLSFLTFVMMVTCIVASCGTTSQMGGSGCFGYWNTDGPLRGTRDANRNRSYPYRQCVEKTVSHSWWKIGRWPPRDDIPSIDSPRFILAAETDWLYSNSWVIGIEIEGNNRGYPLSISNWHEIANDTICGVPVSITIYPHCGTGLAFRRDFDGAVSTLGVSGLQYNIDLLLYDR